MYYQTVIIARQDISPKRVEELSEQFTAIVSDTKGKVTKTEYCGLRPLTYTIKKNRKGHYIILNINASAQSTQELERNLSLNEDVLRFLTVSVDELSNELSSLFKQSRNFVENSSRSQAFKSGANDFDSFDEETSPEENPLLDDVEEDETITR